MAITPNIYRSMYQLPERGTQAGTPRRAPAVSPAAPLPRAAPPVSAGTEAAPKPLGAPRDPNAPPLAGTGAGGAQAPKPPAPNPFADIDKFYEDKLAQHESTWGAQEDAINRAASAGRRRAMAIDARMGSGIGGAFLSGYRQAELGGMQQMQQGRQQHDIAGRNLAREYFQNRLDRANRLQEQQFQREQQGRAFDMEVAKLMVEANQDLPPDLIQRINAGSTQAPGPTQPQAPAADSGYLKPDASGNYVSGNTVVSAKALDNALESMLKKYKILDRNPARMEAVRRYVLRAAAAGKGMPGPEHLRNIYLGQSDIT